MNRPVVAFAMEWIPQYRELFYTELRSLLDERGIDMRLIHGDPPPSRRKRDDSRVLEWGEYLPNRFWTVRGREVTVQPAVKNLRGVDLVVLQHEAGLVLNYLMMAWSRLGGPRVAVWGHGHNFNPLEANPLAEAAKRMTSKWADWTFAYTERSAEVFRSMGVDETRITVVQNSLDLESSRRLNGDVSADVAALADILRSSGAKVAWIVSALDRWKRVPFLIEVLDKVASQVDRFAFVSLGAGDQADLLVEAARTRPWLHPLGARVGADKAAIGALATVTIHPGLAGLHVIESFATETPMITADLRYHSHEITYLTPGNSILLREDADSTEFARAVRDLLTDQAGLVALKAGCRAAAEVYTLEAMVVNFADGIQKALNRYIPTS